MARLSARRKGRGRGGIPQIPTRQLENPYEPIEILPAESIERIHEASLTVLEEIGMDFLHPEALAILRAEGAEVEAGTERVRFERALIEERIKTVPPVVTQRGRNPERRIQLGGRHINFGLVASPPNCSDIERGRRVGNFQDYCDLVRLGQHFNVISAITGYPVEPVDLPPETRHLDCIRAFMELTDKPIHAYSLGTERVLDAIELVKIGFGLDDAGLEAEPALMSVINTSSPLRLDTPMIGGILEFARRRQLLVVTPFTLSGAMSPATVIGAIVQQNAEALATIAFIQMVRPGAPIMYGGFTSNVDMKSGAPAFGTPEYARAALIGGQLTRRYGFPYRSSAVNAANVVDAQAAYENQMSLWSAVMGHANLIKHAAGWLEGGLTASFEKVVLDVEMLQMMSEFLQLLAVDDDALALDAIREVGPGGHFFGAQHTLQRYETAFYQPILSDWRNFESWQEAGSETATQRAHRLYKQALAEFEPPPLDPGIKEALDDFVERRKAEGGAEAA